MNQLVPSVMKLIMKKTVSIQFSGCGKKKRDFSATKIAAAVFCKFSYIFFSIAILFTVHLSSLKLNFLNNKNFI